jgi:cytochrome b
VSPSRSRETAAGGRVPAWDAAVRLLHWLLAALVVWDYFIDDEGGLPHRAIGYVAVGVIVCRLVWAGLREGANGFASLRPSWTKTRDYLRAGAPRTPGHDPLGVWMIWLLWALVLALGVTGWMARLDAFWGDETLDAVHEWLAHALMAAVVVHVAGVLAMTWRWRENLVLAMLTGSKRVDDPTAPPSVRR